MTSGKSFNFRSSDPKILSHLDGKNIAEYLRKLVELDIKGAIGKQTLKDQKTEQEVIGLKMKNRLTLIHDFKVSPDIAVKITNGELKLESIFENEKKKSYLAWVGNKLICDSCGHEHFSAGSRTCYRVECDCKIHEVEL